MLKLTFSEKFVNAPDFYHDIDFTTNLSEDASIGDYVDAFKKFLFAAGFYPDTINKYINDDALDEFYNSQISD